MWILFLLGIIIFSSILHVILWYIRKRKEATKIWNRRTEEILPMETTELVLSNEIQFKPSAPME